MASDLRKKLDKVRRFTGDRFSAGRGYDARKTLSKKRQKTIERYFDAITELTAREHLLYKPKRGEKKEVFEYTGQKGYGLFNVGIIHKPDSNAHYTFDFDRERPKGSRFQVINKNTGERSWHVPADPFWEFDGDEDELREYYGDLLDEYAEDAEVFLINAGEHHMWGSAGGADFVADKLADLMNQYGSRYFDPFNKNSNHINNWFRGMTAYASDRDVAAYLDERAEHQEKQQAKYNYHMVGTDRGNVRSRVRILRDGSIANFVDGKLDASSRLYPSQFETIKKVRMPGEKRTRNRKRKHRKRKTI